MSSCCATRCSTSAPEDLIACVASSIWPIFRATSCSRCSSSRGGWRARPEPHALAGKILGLLFMNPSLRTLASFQSGMARLGGSSFVITPGSGTWQLETRHGVGDGRRGGRAHREGMPVLASYCDALGIRAFADGKDLAADLSEQKFSAMAQLVGQAADQSRIGGQSSLPVAGRLEDAR